MIKKLLYICTTLLLFTIAQVFAIDAPSNFRITETSNTSATLEWDEADAAAAYSIYYGENSGNLSGNDLAGGSPYTLVNLQENTIYYAQISANNDSFDESDPSAEVSFTTGVQPNESTQSSFALEDIEIISETKLKLSFNAEINDSLDAPREFKISNKFDDLEILEVLNSEIDEQEKNVLILTMQNSIPTSAQYNVVVIRLNDADGNNIQNGIDWVASFATPDSYETIIEEVIEEEPILESAGPTEAQLEVSGGSSGANLSDEDLAKTTESTAETAENLPTTGAEHWFLGILALMLWALVFKFRTQQNS